MKVCRKCGETRQLSEFSVRSSSQDGLASRCKSCDAVYSAERRDAGFYTNAGKQAARETRRSAALERLKREAKICPKCKLEKSVANFSRNRNANDGLQCYCKPCMDETTKESTRRRVERLGTKFGSPEAYENKKAADRAAYRRDPSKIRNSNYRRKYGITLEQYSLMHELQAGLCAICTQPESAHKKVLAVDHHYLSGTVRGLLCQRHNLGIGHFLEDIIMMGNAQVYLATHNNQWKEVEELILMLSEALEASRG